MYARIVGWIAKYFKVKDSRDFHFLLPKAVSIHSHCSLCGLGFTYEWFQYFCTLVPTGSNILGCYEPFYETRSWRYWDCCRRGTSEPSTSRTKILAAQLEILRAISSQSVWIRTILLDTIDIKLISCCPTDELTDISHCKCDWSLPWRRNWRSLLLSWRISDVSRDLC